MWLCEKYTYKELEGLRRKYCYCEGANSSFSQLTRTPAVPGSPLVPFLPGMPYVLDKKFQNGLSDFKYYCLES